MFDNIEKLVLKEFPVHHKKILKLLKPAIGIKKKNKVSPVKLNNVLSKFGGVPNVPQNFNWPTFEGRPLSFLCQIQLENLKKFKSFHNLPEIGIIYFFILTDGIHNRYPQKQGEFKVLYYNFKGDIHSEYKFDKNNHSPKIFRECYMSFYKHFTLPSYQNYQRINMSEVLSDAEDNKIDELYKKICHITGHSPDIGHLILGDPQAQQGTVTYWWAYNELNYSSYPLNDEQKSTLNALEKKFKLLLQLDFNDDNLNFSEFGGSGTAYFGIKKEDFDKRDFDKTVLICQST